MHEDVFDHRGPEALEVPLVVSVPHTGVLVPPDIAGQFASDAIRALPMTDWHLHRLYDFVPGLGGDLLCARYSRFVVDLNRPPLPRALYPGRFETGLVALETFQGEPVWLQPPGEAEITRRRERFHAPYHRKLEQLLAGKLERFGHAWLIDAHSIASWPTRMHDTLDRDIYLGNRDGTSCDAAWFEFVAGQFELRGMSVSRNHPYKGGYITDYYGQRSSVDALQIEMNQQLYMDQDDPAGGPVHPRFAHTRERLAALFSHLVSRMGGQAR